MKNTKRRMETFTFFNQKGICNHLEKMAQKGWMIEKITNTGWTYRRIEPKRIKFAASYYPKASEFDPEPTEGQRMFHAFCAHTGWELACTSAQLQIFYNEQENPTPIATEPALELEAIHASARKSFLPSYFILLGISVLQGLLFLSSLLGDPIGLLASPSRLFTGLCSLLLFGLCLVELLCYLTWYSRAKQAAAHGEFLSSPDTTGFQKATLVVLLVGVVYYLANTLLAGDPMRRFIVLSMFPLCPLFVLLVNGIKEFLKRRKASRKLNRTVTLAASVMLYFLLIVLISLVTIRLARNGFFAKPEEQTDAHNGTTWVIHQDQLPLTIEDLTDIQFDGYIRQQSGDESMLLGKLDVHQWPRYDTEDSISVPSLKYTMVVVKAPFLYELCKNRLLEKPGNTRETMSRTYQEESPASWDCNRAYRLYDPEYGPRNLYLLCYDRVIVEIQFDWEPTDAQKAVVAQRLGAPR